MKDIVKCPHCGSNIGLKTTIKSNQYYGFDGEPQGFFPIEGSETKWAYCRSCNKPVIEISKLL